MVDELYHFGVKGMRWGVRRYQNEDGTLTDLGQKRQRMKDATRLATNLPTVDNAAEADYAKREFADAKTRLKLENQNKKSKRQRKLEESYKAKGYTKDEAEIKAYNRAYTEKILTITGGIALTSAAAYVAYRHYDKVTDRVLSAGSKLQRITNDKNEPLSRTFYASVNKHDNERYVGLYSKDYIGRGFEPFKRNLVANSDIKIASEKSAKDIMTKWLKDNPDMKRQLSENINTRASIISPLSPTYKLFKKAVNDINNGKNTDNVYRAFNVLMVSHDNSQQPLNDSFYNKLKESGYGAIRDINDKFYSGYYAKDPLIIFGTANIKPSSTKPMEKLGRDYINETFKREVSKVYLHSIGKSTLKNGSLIAGIVGGTKLLDKNRENKFIENYRKEHPNSKLSRNEILKIGYMNNA